MPTCCMNTPTSTSLWTLSLHWRADQLRSAVDGRARAHLARRHPGQPANLALLAAIGLPELAARDEHDYLRIAQATGQPARTPEHPAPQPARACKPRH